MSRVSSAFLPWQRVHVSGPSMVPTLHDRDVLLVRRGARVRIGDVVLARFRGMPDRYVIKRAHHPENGGWHVRSDNEVVDGDSRRHGVADVLGKAVLVWPAHRRSLLPRRVR